MKAIKFFSLAAASMLLAACSSDEPGVNVPDDGYNNYILVQVSAKDNGTRATTYNDTPAYADGTGNECKVSSALFAFYNAGGALVGQQWMEITADDTDTQPTGNVETILTKKVPVNFNDNFQGKVLCFLNVDQTAEAPTTLNDETTKYNLAQVANTTDESNGFVMTNSTYYDAEGNLAFASDIKGVYEDGVTVENPEATTIYVERVAARVSVTEKEQAVTNVSLGEYATDANGGTVTLKFNMDGWGLTATANDSYKIKRFWNNSNADLNETAAGNLLDGSFASKWNHYANFRSYWATALNYYDSDKVEHKNQTTNQGGLAYASWNSCTAAKGASLYTLEQNNNLGAEKTLHTGVLVVGTMTLNGADAQDLYTYGFSSTCKSVIYTTDQLWTALIKHLNVKNGADAVDATAAKTVFELTKDAEKSGVMNIALKAGANVTGWTIGGKELNATNLATAAEALNTINLYKDGKCYYWVPIHQFGLVSDAAVNGSYGVMRNHAYQIELQGIGGLALPVNDPTDPLIPENPESFYYMNAAINVLAWRVMPTQGTILK